MVRLYSFMINIEDRNGHSVNLFKKFECTAIAGRCLQELVQPKAWSEKGQLHNVKSSI